MNSSPSQFRAAAWMLGSITSFLVMSVAGRVATAELDVFQVMLMRSVLGFVMLLPMVHLAGGFAAMRTARPWAHVGRNVFHYAGQYAWLLALGMIPLAELISIEFTMPFWVAILAVLFLGETITWRKAAAIFLGIVGVAIIVRPGLDNVEPGHLIMLAGAVAFAVSVIMVKAMTSTESVTHILFWMLIIQSAIGLVPALYVWQTPSLAVMPAVVIVAFTGTFSHLCMTRALSHADATFIMPIDFLRVVASALIGWALYSEHIDMLTAVGTALILLGNLINLPRRARRPRQTLP